jgi:branched-chain amino acid transport system ATP-binding protein
MVFGPLVGAALIVLLPEYLSSLAAYRVLFFGALLLGALWLAPGGVAGAIGNHLRRRPPHRVRPSDGIDVLAWLRQGTHGRVLRVEGLSLALGGVRAVADVVFTARSGQITSLIGPNGAGKTTVINVLSGFYTPDVGSVTLGGQHVLGRPSHAIARLGMARTYQTSQLFPTLSTAHRIASTGLILVPEGRQVFPELTVLDNIRLGAYCRRGFDASQDLEPMLARFPALKPRLQARAGLLSGGEQQMLAIARGLVARPMLLLLDEPSLGLAPTLIDTLFGVLAELREAGITVLLVDQRVDLALAVADRGYVLQNGRIVHEGSVADIHNDAALERAYVGEFD